MSLTPAAPEKSLESTRAAWLFRRLSRMYWQEVPYRAWSVVRGIAQSKGAFDASSVPPPAVDAQWGNPWCANPGPSSAGAEYIRCAAQRLLEGHLEVFGHPVAMPGGIPEWNVDPVTGTRIDTTFGLFIDFRHIEGVDIKFLWEVNRHLWWIPLAQAFALDGDQRYLDRLGQLLRSWLDSCPYARGANWSSPVEHGIRLINWSVVWSLIGGDRSPLFAGAQGQRLLDRWLASIYQHMRFASDNYSKYSSADNHLIGEAAGVYVAAHVWDRWVQSRQMRREAKAILERETLQQFAPDGVNLEQASCYHKFSLQFLLAAGLTGRANGDDLSVAFWARIEAAIVFLASMLDAGGHVPPMGDSDDGEVWRLGQGPAYCSYRSIVAIGAALLRRGDLQAKAMSCGTGVDEQLAWLPGLEPVAPDESAMQALPTRFERGGYVVLGESLHRPNEFRATVDCGPLGYNRIAGHGHADALAVQVSWGGVQMLVDPGTYCYNAAPDLRHFFRGTHAHNTLVVDDCDQSAYGASFLWLRDVSCTVVSKDSSHGRSIHASHDGYSRLADPVIHHRCVVLRDDGSLLVDDWIECVQSHRVELLWHAPVGATFVRESDGVWLLTVQERVLRLTIESPAPLEISVIEGRESPPQGWVSTRFYQRAPAPVLSARGRLGSGQELRTVIERRSAR
ncbi:MAG TPA: alginate lyase family protein [Steroidobacteraceae bacterium]